MRIRSLPGTLMLAVGMVATGVLAPLPALASPVLHLNLGVGGACPYGTRPNTDPIKVKLLRSNGTARETKHDNTANTHWSVCFTHVPVPGDRIQMINGTSADRTVTVPDLTLSVDRATIGSNSIDWGGVTDSHGRFTGAPPVSSFDPGDTLDLICQTPAGDRGRLIRTL